MLVQAIRHMVWITTLDQSTISYILLTHLDRFHGKHNRQDFHYSQRVSKGLVAVCRQLWKLSYLQMS